MLINNTPINFTLRSRVKIFALANKTSEIWIQCMFMPRTARWGYNFVNGCMFVFFFFHGRIHHLNYYRILWARTVINNNNNSSFIRNEIKTLFLPFFFFYFYNIEMTIISRETFSNPINKYIYCLHVYY